MADIQIKGLAKLDRNLSVLEQQVFPEAARRAVNRVATTLRSRTAKTVSKWMGTKQKAVRDRIKVRKAGRGARPVATLFIKGGALNLIEFKARQIKKGVSSAPWGDRKIFRSAFITTIGGAELVMRRKKIGGKLVSRLPIRPMLGPGVAESAAEPEMEEQRREVVRERLPVELESQLEHLVNRMSR